LSLIIVSASVAQNSLSRLPNKRGSNYLLMTNTSDKLVKTLLSDSIGFPKK